ncbi:hypothetical protein [Congregicoccus parvus]|uniref:hypothetical protein n=1 Tax=Congregicoccus parvus TaxID=3081749 RepID=UPI003FA55735
MQVQFPALVIDAASSEVVVGLWDDDPTRDTWWRRTVDAGTGVFEGVEEILRRAGTEIEGIASFVFCAGPGSLLGVRVTAMALRTWLAVRGDRRLPSCFEYRSLELVAADLRGSGEKGPFSVVTDARRQAWNVLTVAASGSRSDIARVATDALVQRTGARWVPRGFPCWQSRPSGCFDADYQPERLRTLLACEPALLRPASEPEAFAVALPEYVKAPATEPLPADRTISAP